MPAPFVNMKTPIVYSTITIVYNICSASVHTSPTSAWICSEDSGERGRLSILPRPWTASGLRSRSGSLPTAAWIAAPRPSRGAWSRQSTGSTALPLPPKRFSVGFPEGTEARRSPPRGIAGKSAGRNTWSEARRETGDPASRSAARRSSTRMPFFGAAIVVLRVRVSRRTRTSSETARSRNPRVALQAIEYEALPLAADTLEPARSSLG